MVQRIAKPTSSLSTLKSRAGRPRGPGGCCTCPQASIPCAPSAAGGLSPLGELDLQGGAHGDWATVDLCSKNGAACRRALVP